MNIIKEIAAYYKLDMPGKLSFTGQSLYIALLHTANDVYSSSITPSNPLLMAKTGIKDVKTLEKARHELEQNGLIKYISNAKSRLAGKYEILGLERHLVENFRNKSRENPEVIQENFRGPSRKNPLHIQDKEKRRRDIKFIYTPDFEKWYLEYPNSQAKADSFRNFEKIRKDKGLDYIWLCTRNYLKYLDRNSDKKQFPYSSNNFFGQKQYYLDYETDKGVSTNAYTEDRVVPYRG